MNVTFLVGNGFDINLGLKTKYTDFYPSYLAKGYDDILSKDIKNNYENWANLETALGEALANIFPDQIREFLDCKGNLEKCLAAYLRSETKRIDVSSEKLPCEFQKGITNFHQEFSKQDKEDFLTWLGKVPSVISYQFISFNYTDTLDQIVTVSKNVSPFGYHACGGIGYNDKLGTVHHIHGTLSSDLILGLNDPSQIANSLLTANKSLTDYIIKSQVNEALGERRVIDAKRIIDNSDYIGIYGMSLGDTDKMWWEYLLAWLQAKNTRRLVLYVHADLSDNPSGQEKLRQIDNWKEIFLSQAGSQPDIADKVRSQIIVIIRSKIFDFGSITISERDPENVLLSV